MAKKKNKGGTAVKKQAEAKANSKPKIQPALKTVSPTELLKRTLAAMETENQIPTRVGKDFMESMAYVIEKALADFEAVNVGGMVKITPRFHPARVAEVRETWGDTESPMVKKHLKAAVKVRVGPLKRLKDAVPTTQKAQTVLRKGK